MTPAATPQLAERRAAAAALLWDAWQSQDTLEALPAELRPATVDEGWAIQRALDAHAGAAVGWKIAATSAGGQAAIGADGPLVGRLYDHCLVEAPATIDATRMTMRVAEAEFAFRFGRGLEPQGRAPGRDRVLAAIDALIPAIEVPDTRLADHLAAGLPSMVADGLCAGRLVLGRAVTRWSADDLPRRHVTMRQDGAPISEGRGADVLGDPVEALVWAVGQLHRRGERVRAGEVITTGACTPPRPVVNGSRFEADFGPLGEVVITFTPAEAG
jgi:2-keto-4-pentenoate hydratase